MSGCPDRLTGLSAYVDAELTPAATFELEQHLAACPDCRAELASLTAVSDAVQSAYSHAHAPAAPDVLRSRITAALAAEHVAGTDARAVAVSVPTADAAPASAAGSASTPDALPRPVTPASQVPARRALLGRRTVGALATAATVVLALVGGFELGAARGQAVARDALTAELLSGHLRALLPGRLTDVQSSDRHQVKPRFAGRLDFSPPVPDLAAAGFPLLGGRVDFVAGQRAAVLVYGRRLHVIDVFVLPTTDRPLPLPGSRRLGYNLLSWREGPLRLIAISDLDPTELRQLAQLHARAAAPPP